MQQMGTKFYVYFIIIIIIIFVCYAQLGVTFK